MAPVAVTSNNTIEQSGCPKENEEQKKCPIVNGNLIYPPVAPIPAIRRARGKSPAKTISRHPSMHSLECPEDFIRPDLPSRCTWSPHADKAKSPHTKDSP